MALGVLFAGLAGLMWGLVFVGPLILSDYPPAMLSFGRYLAFGLIALPLAAWDRAGLRALTRADWLEALKLALVGNIIYYLFLASALQAAGGPLPTMIIGTLPVVIALSEHLRGTAPDGATPRGPIPWGRLAPSLALIGLGLALVNQVEWQHLQQDASADRWRYLWGAVLAVGAVVCWTWYPLRNADWLRAHPDRSPRVWATAQGVATLPLAALGAVLTSAVYAWQVPEWPQPFGPRPALYLGLMLAIGLLASWVGTLCWNEASQRLPTHLVGQLIVFETLAALAYAYVWRGAWPDRFTVAGVLALVAGVWWALRTERAAQAQTRL